MRLLALSALAGLALLAWLNVRDLLRRASYEQVTDPADDVQPADPVTWPALIAQYDPWRKYGTGDPPFQPWVNTTAAPDIGDTLEPLTVADRDWLDQTVRSTQAQLMGPLPWRDPFRRSTQTGPRDWWTVPRTETAAWAPVDPAQFTGTDDNAISTQTGPLGPTA